MIPWRVTIMLCIGSAFMGMMLLALVIANGRDDR